MCGIVGLFFKNKSLESQLGHYFSEMLDCMSSRGPDSAGFAVYSKEGVGDVGKVTLYHSMTGYDWKNVQAVLSSGLGVKVTYTVNASHAVFLVSAEAGEAEIRILLKREFPDVKIMSMGRRMVIMKEVGTPAEVMAKFNLAGMSGTHAIGHTRMATESAVSTAGSHPFSTGSDLCLVHNGSLSNHNRLRRLLSREGIEFQTENDSEVAAGYLTWRMNQGESLEGALRKALEDLDGFYTFTIGTRNGFAVLRDPIACKPAVLAETEDYVAMSSEYRSLTSLPGIEKARLWEPEPARVYTWSL